MSGSWIIVASSDVRAESAQHSCLPDCVSVLNLAGVKAVDDIRGFADLISDRVKAAEDGKEKVDILNRFFFDGLRFRVEDGLDSAEGLLPADVLSGRRGTCVGLTGVYLALGGFLDLPVAAVSAPNHMFVRFDDGHDVLNVELLQDGKILDDDWYVHNYKIPVSSVSSGVFLRSLAETEFLGYVYASLGALYSKSGDFSNSQVLYEAALRSTSRLPIAYYNLGNDLVAQARYSQAIDAFDEALDLYPTDIFAFNNRGIALCRLGKTRRARKDFLAALELDPSFTQARANLSNLRCNSRKDSKP